jgi:membrane-associated phospholipid phosphatase
MKLLLIGLVIVALFAALALGWRWLEANVRRIAGAVDRVRRRLIASPAVGRLRERYPRLTRFLAARFQRGEYLGLHLTVGLLICIVGLFSFARIAVAVVRQDAITQLDVQVQDFLHSHGTLFGYGFWSVITTLGAGVTLTILGVGVAVLLVIRRRWVVLAGWAAAILGGGLLDGVLKIAFRRQRPETAMDFLSRMSWSFPSGHSLGSLVTYGMLAYLIILALKGRQRWQISAMVGALLLILSIGFSRLYLGVHYFSDVVGGYSAGALWLSACISGLEVSRRIKGKTPVEP